MAERVIHSIDAINEVVGKTFAWLILALTFALSYEVVLRYVFDQPTTWAFDAGYNLFGAFFMMGSAYTLSKNGHVRGDIFYRKLSERTQATIDLTLYLLVFFPALLAILAAGIDYSWASFLIREASNLSPYRRPLYPLKAIIPTAAFLLLLQGVAQVLRCVIAIRTGRWPPDTPPPEVLE